MPTVLGDAYLRRYRRGVVDGKTAYMRRFGKPWNQKMAIFGEKIIYLPVGARPSRLQSDFKFGIFLSLIEGTSHFYVGIRWKIDRARTIKKLPYGDRVDVELFNSIRGTPWKLDPQEASA